MIYSAVEQFETRIITEFRIPSIYYNLQGYFLYNNLINSLIILTIFYFLLFQTSKKNRLNINIVKLFTILIDLINSNLVKNKHTIRFRTKFLILFLFILLNNFCGLFPFFFTLTSQFWITFTISFLYFISITIYAVYLYNIKFFKLFWPSNVPVFLLPFLFIIEFISYFSRVFSLSIRLFANIMAGHTLIHIISNFVILFYSKKFSYIFRLLFLLPFTIIILIMFLEIGVAFLQAYVFLILLCIYLNDIMNLLNH